VEIVGKPAGERKIVPEELMEDIEISEYPEDEVSVPHRPSCSHACTSHQFEYKTISRIFGPENDFIDNILFQDLKLALFPPLKSFRRTGLSQGFWKPGSTEFLI
jgi:hypothetical protein